MSSLNQGVTETHPKATANSCDRRDDLQSFDWNYTGRNGLTCDAD